MKIKSLRVLLPAFVDYEDGDVGDTVFVYIDQMTGDIIIPDPAAVANADALKEKLEAYLETQKRDIKVPRPPLGNINKFKPEDFTERK